MSPELRDTVFRFGLPILSIFMVIFVCYKRKWPLRETLALRLPTWKQVGIWTPVFLVLFLGGEYYYATLNLAEGIAWGAMKQQLFEYLNDHIGPAREEYDRLIGDPAIVEAELQKGAERAREIAAPYMNQIRQAIGIRKLG